MKQTLIALITMFAITSMGEVSLSWNIDLSPHLGSITNWHNTAGYNEPSNVRQFANDDVGLIFGGGSQSNTLLVVNSDGTVLINDTFAVGGSTAHFLGRASIEQFALTIDSSFQRILRIYEYDGTSLTITNVSAGAFSLPQYETAVSSVFYTLTGTTLSKYQFDSEPVHILGDVYAGIDGSNFKLTWDSVAGEEYQIQSTLNLTNWTDVGSIITGTGSPISWANALTNSKSFFRVLEK